MKEKLSFLALPLCLGLVITLVLAACSSGGGSSPSHETSSSSGYNGELSSNVQVDGKIEFEDDFKVDYSGKTATLFGTVKATVADPIVKIDFFINNSRTNASWILYNDEPVDGTIYLPNKLSGLGPNIAEITFSNDDDIPCDEEFRVSLDIYIESGKKGTAFWSFKKPSKFCPVSSSAGAVSSSSVAVWRFGQPTVEEVFAGTPVTIVGSGGFELVGKVPLDGQPDLRIYNGKVRPANPCKDSDLDDIDPGEPYSSERNCLGNTPAKVSSLGKCEEGGFDVCYAQPEEYFLIYLEDDDGKIYKIYLIQFKPIEGLYTTWPKKATYWEALEHPQ